jgi:LacI family transcriptional regulator
MMPQKRTSLKDIAERVGVSIALVSYVLNNQKEGRISKEITKKIKDAAIKLNYRTNEIARSLKTKKTFTIGLIVADISNPFSSNLARIIEDEAYKHQYTVIFGSSDENIHKFEKLMDTFLNRQVDGLIISPPAHSDAHILHLKKLGIPFVILDRYFPEIETNCVVLDNFSAAHQAVTHLVETGRKVIGMITYGSELFHLKERERGYLTGLKNGAVKFNKSWLKTVSITNNGQEIESSVQALLSLNSPVDAMLFGSNQIASAALRFINSSSIKVPQDLAVVSFDETDIFDFFYAPLTYIRQPLQEMGQIATSMLLSAIASKAKPQLVFLPGELVVRKSTRKKTRFQPKL